MEGDKLYSLYSWIYRGWQEKLEHVISMGSLGSSHRLVPVDRVTCCTRRELLLVWWLVVRVLSQRGISAASAPLKLDDHCSCLSSLWSSAVLSARRVSGHFYTACIPARGCRWDKRRVRGTIETRGSGENSIMNALRFPSPFFFFFSLLHHEYFFNFYLFHFFDENYDCVTSKEQLVKAKWIFFGKRWNDSVSINPKLLSIAHLLEFAGTFGHTHSKLESQWVSQA